MIQSATLATFQDTPGYVVYHQARDVSGQRVCFRDLHVCWHFPPPSGIEMPRVLSIHRRKRQTSRQRCFAMNVNAM